MSEKNLGVISHEVLNNLNLDKNLKQINSLLKQNHRSNNLLALKAIILSKLGFNYEAEKIFEQITQSDEKNTELLYNYSIILKLNNNFNKFIEIIKKILNQKSDHVGALNQLGLYYLQESDYTSSLEVFDKILKIDPNSINSLINIANIYILQSNFKLAKSYLNQALQINKNSYLIHYNFGNLFVKEEDLESAINSFKKAIVLNYKFKPTYNNLCGVYYDQGKITKSIETLEKVLEFDDQDEEIIIRLYYLKSSICSWSNYYNLQQKLLNIGTLKKPIFPFRALTLEDSPSNQQKRSLLWSKSLSINNLENLKTKHPNIRNNKIKIGYFSCDFHGHATMHLMSGLFKSHNQEKFEIVIFNYSSRNNPKWANFINSNSNKVIDLKNFDNELEILKVIYSEELDIAIDLKGYTPNSKINLFKNRLAKVHISFLGYPGTLGADFIDYIVADKVVIPDEYRKFYTEKIIYMPDCYQPNDEDRIVPAKNSSKADHGLPSDSFVFCCFNDLYKISPQEIESWAKILLEVNNSVLWILTESNEAKDNFLLQINNRGIAKSRVIFANRLNNELHLERHLHADLFLDCFNYNAHTTASDALWMNVPIVTKIGKQFSARVASSLLTTLGLTELITSSQKEYESLAIKLAKNSDFLKEIKEKLKTNSKSMPLFNSKNYTKKYEFLLEKALKNISAREFKDIEFK